ncbi:MAG: CgeB family protein [Gemmatimonadetes bacterium]|nr:CgeB family protein [Gemmatimonadota bacterium]
MTGPFAGTRVLLVDLEADPTGHAGLRKRALERLGCVVATCDLKEKQGLLARLRGGGAQDRLGRAVLQHQARLVLVVEGAELTAGMVTSLKRDSDAAWAAWFIGETRSLPLMEALSTAYDVLFVPGTDLVEQLRGGPSRPPTIHLPPGCDPSVHRPMRARDQFRANVVFVGSATPRREQLLGELTEFGLAIWGPGWRRTPLRDYCRGEMLDLDDYVRAYAGASVAINVHREGASGGGTATGCNQRLFELAAIGVPQVVDNRVDLPLAFDAGKELLTFDTGAELRLLVQELLHDPTTAERLAQAGRRRALAEHTYMHRLGAILSATKR